MPRSISDMIVDAVIDIERTKRFRQRFSYKRKRFLPRLSELITSTKQHLKIVVDDEYVKIFQEDGILESLRTILKQGVPVFFVFHLSDDFSEALGKLRNEYPVLCSLFDEYEKFRIYWCPRDPSQSYFLSDASNICYGDQSRILKRKMMVAFILSTERIPTEELPSIVRAFSVFHVKITKFFAEMEGVFDELISAGACPEVQK